MAQVCRRKALGIISSKCWSASVARSLSSSLHSLAVPPPTPEAVFSTQRTLSHGLLQEPTVTKSIQALSPFLTVPSRLLASRRNTTAACPPPEQTEEYKGDLDVEEAMADLNMNRLDDKMYDYGKYGAGQEEEEEEYEEEEPAPDPEADALFSPAEED